MQPSRLLSELLCYLSDHRACTCDTLLFLRSSVLNHSFDGPFARRLIEWTGRAHVLDKISSEWNRGQFWSTSDQDFGPTNQLIPPVHRILKSRDLFSITIWHLHMLLELNITKLSIIINWIMSLEILALSHVADEFTRQSVKRMGLSHKLDKLSSEWFRTALLSIDHHFRGTCF